MGGNEPEIIGHAGLQGNFAAAGTWRRKQKGGLPAALCVRLQRRRLTAAAHHVEELDVVLGRAHLVEDELHRLDLVHRVQQLAQIQIFCSWSALISSSSRRVPDLFRLMAG